MLITTDLDNCERKWGVRKRWDRGRIRKSQYSQILFKDQLLWDLLLLTSEKSLSLV